MTRNCTMSTLTAALTVLASVLVGCTAFPPLDSFASEMYGYSLSSEDSIRPGNSGASADRSFSSGTVSYGSSDGGLRSRTQAAASSSSSGSSVSTLPVVMNTAVAEGRAENLQSLAAATNESSSTTPVLNDTSSVYFSTELSLTTVAVADNVTETINTSQKNETEKVIIPTEDPQLPYYSETFKRTVAWLNDTYTLSILLPVCAGFVFASFIIVSVATCRCIRRRCCCRRLRRKVLPDTVKNMRASDRAKLLAETSDEEF